MPIDLPPDSLGPKPTKKQMELLKLMAEQGRTVHTWSGVRLSSGGAYVWLDKANGKSEKVSRTVVQKFFDWGWLQLVDNDWKGAEYIVTDRARKVIELGETR
jgi:hypothetical protein